MTSYTMRECFADPYPYGRYAFFAGDQDLAGRTVAAGHEIIDNVSPSPPKICNQP